jgi:predicted nucleic acid-binding Zn ribbon protein
MLRSVDSDNVVMSEQHRPFLEVSAVKALRELLGPVLGQVSNRTGSLAALHPVWQQVVGELAARHTRPARLDGGGTLVIACDAPAWREVLEQEREGVRAKLNAALGEARVDALVFEIT